MPGTPGGPIGMRPRPLPRIPMPPRPGDERKSLWYLLLQMKLWPNVTLGTRDESLRMSSWEANVHTTRDEFSWLKNLTRLFVHKEPLNSFALFNFNFFIVFSFFGTELLHMPIGSLSKDVFERRTSTGSEAFSLFICLDANKFVLLSVFSLIKTIYTRVSTKPLLTDVKSPLLVDVRRSKTLLLKLPNPNIWRLECF